MDNETRHEWTEGGRRYFVDSGDGGRIAAQPPSPQEAPASLPDFRDELHRQQGVGAAVREILRLARRERGLLTLVGRLQKELWRRVESKTEGERGAHCELCDWYIYEDDQTDHSEECLLHFSPDAQKAAEALEDEIQRRLAEEKERWCAEWKDANERMLRGQGAQEERKKAAGEMEELRGGFQEALQVIKRQAEEIADCRAIVSPAAGEESLAGAIRNLQQAHLTERGNAEKLEADNEALRARLARLDALLASEKVPDGLWNAVVHRQHGTEGWHATVLAWRWFREALTAPPTETGRPADPLAAAIEVATRAHRSQVYRGYGDRPDEPYILHPLRVALSVSPRARVVAVLHDVLEDTWEPLPQWLTAEERDALLILTRRKKSEMYEVYISRIVHSGSAIAVEVKLADLHENLRNNPPENLRSRYIKATTVLEMCARGVVVPPTEAQEEPTALITDHAWRPRMNGSGCAFIVRGAMWTTADPCYCDRPAEEHAE